MSLVVLHTHWSRRTDGLSLNHGMFFWAEIIPSRPPSPPRRRKGIQPHPLAAPLKQVKALLEEQTGLPISSADFAPFPIQANVPLLLPTARRLPLPSLRPLAEEEDRPPASPTWQAWRVPGLRLPTEQAVRVLARLPSRQNLPPHLRYADDLLFWRTALYLALEILARQKFLPALTTPQHAPKAAPEARWLPLLDGPKDGPRLARLAEAMPDICRAEAPSPEQAPAPRLLLDDFFQTVTDALARAWGRAALPRPSRNVSDELIGRWLEALFTPAISPRVTGSPAQLNRLAGSFEAWLRRLRVAGDRHFRVAFRLEAPPSPAQKEAGWQLQFLLQARDDPSLLIPARQVWQTDGTALSAGGRVIEQPQEMLLAGLGYAARLFPPLRRSLQSKQPDALSLSSEEVYTFLREAAPLLEESGFAVFVPSWWQQTSARLGLRLHLKGKTSSSRDAVSSGLLSLERLVHFSWELTLGDTPLTRQEFESLVALKSPLVQVRGQWVRLDPEQVERVLQFWQRHEAAEQETDLLEALQLQLAEEVDGLPVQDVVVEGALNDWLEPLNRREKLEPLPPPQSLRATLRPYQERGYAWLDFMRRAGLGACLADDMGLGKTIQTLAALLRVKEMEGRLPAPTLLVAPTSVLINWAKEAERFTPDLSVWLHHGPQRLQGEAFVAQARQTDIIVTSYAILRRDAETLRQISWFGVVLDEAQNIKNPDTKQARAARSMPARFRLALTGTPIENRLSELWSIFHFLNPGYLGARQTFRRRFAIPIERYNDEAAAGRLRRLTAPFILRRLKTDPTVIQDLPDKVETKVYCPLTTEQASLYEAVVQESLTIIEDAAEAMRRRGLVLSMLMKLKQICNHPAQFLHEGNGQPPAGELEKRSGKLRRLLQMLDEILAAGERALIFTQFSEMGRLLRHTIQQQLGVPALFLYGATPSRQRAAMVQRFQEAPDAPPVFILSLKAGGTGLNLTRATHVFHFDRWWNPAVEDQATDRAFRIGQKHNVEVHKFVCVGTLEERIDEMIEAKKSLARRIVGSGEDWLTELSTDDLRDLVALRRELIEE